MFQNLKLQDDAFMNCSITTDDSQVGTNKGTWSDFKKTMKTGIDNYDFFPWCKPVEKEIETTS